VARSYDTRVLSPPATKAPAVSADAKHLSDLDAPRPWRVLSLQNSGSVSATRYSAARM
jgi:hypothetical protein